MANSPAPIELLFCLLDSHTQTHNDRPVNEATPNHQGRQDVFVLSTTGEIDPLSNPSDAPGSVLRVGDTYRVGACEQLAPAGNVIYLIKRCDSQLIRARSMTCIPSINFV